MARTTPPATSSSPATMEFSTGGVTTIQQNERILQQHQNQRTQFLFEQQQQRLQNPTKRGARNTDPVFVDPSALNSTLGDPSTTADRHSSASTQGSRAHQDSPFSNAADSLSSPTSSLTPYSPPIDPVILGQAKGTRPTELVETTGPPKRRRGRPRLSESSPHAARAAVTKTTKTPKKAASRRTSTVSVSGADDFADEHGGTNDKKNRIRARNREAAYKCRQKKQKGVEELQTQEAMAENINKNLHSEASMLRAEILMLKNMVLQHGGCGCSYIEEYISGAAQNLVQSSMAAAAAAPGGGMAPQHIQPGTSRTGGDSYVDWKMLDVESGRGMSILGSESGFSGFDDTSSHGARAQSQGRTLV